MFWKIYFFRAATYSILLITQIKYYFYNVFGFAKSLRKKYTNRIYFQKKSFLCAHADVTDQLWTLTKQLFAKV